MMKALIIEDETLAADKLEDMLSIIDPDITVVAKIGSIYEAVKWLLQHTADLIFLDIQLSDGISFSIFDQVEVNTPVIFTTAYDQYAIDAFQLNSISYLLKPIRQRDLAKSLNKYKTLQSSQHIDFQALHNLIQGEKPVYKKRFLIQIGEKIKKIEVQDIAYFFIFHKSVYLKTLQGMDFPLDYTLDKLESVLNPELFFRINRKYIINITAIVNMTAYSRGRVKLELKPKAEDEYDAIVSIDRARDFKHWMDK